MVAEAVFSTGALGTYCTTADVLALLAGYDLSGLGDAETVESRVAALLPAAMEAINGASGRDFLFHQGAQLRLSGTGAETLSLAEAGAVPIIAVSELTVDGEEVPLDRVWVGADDGSLRLVPGSGGSSRFTRGALNVKATVDWGYISPPSDISTAQARLAAAELLAALDGPGCAPESVRIGDYEVRYGGGGAHRDAICALTEGARRITARYRRLVLAAV
jgi:hypothetical protein